MSSAVYALATLVFCFCATLRLSGYKAGGHRLLLWCGISAGCSRLRSAH
jgi:hypothetical protein